MIINFGGKRNYRALNKILSGRKSEYNRQIPDGKKKMPLEILLSKGILLHFLY